MDGPVLMRVEYTATPCSIMAATEVRAQCAAVKAARFRWDASVAYDSCPSSRYVGGTW